MLAFIASVVCLGQLIFATCPCRHRSIGTTKVHQTRTVNDDIVVHSSAVSVAPCSAPIIAATDDIIKVDVWDVVDVGKQRPIATDPSSPHIGTQPFDTLRFCKIGSASTCLTVCSTLSRQSTIAGPSSHSRRSSTTAAADSKPMPDFPVTAAVDAASVDVYKGTIP